VRHVPVVPAANKPVAHVGGARVALQPHRHDAALVVGLERSNHPRRRLRNRTGAAHESIRGRRFRVHGVPVIQATPTCRMGGAPLQSFGTNSLSLECVRSKLSNFNRTMCAFANVGLVSYHRRMHARRLAALLLLTACSSSTSTTTTPGPGDAQSDAFVPTTRDGGEDATDASDANVGDACADPKGAPTEMSTEDCVVVGACGCSGGTAYRCATFSPPKVYEGGKRGLGGCQGFGDVVCCAEEACVRSARSDSKCTQPGRSEAYDCLEGMKRPLTPNGCGQVGATVNGHETVCCG
jgi:hypothetical protein